MKHKKILYIALTVVFCVGFFVCFSTGDRIYTSKIQAEEDDAQEEATTQSVKDMRKNLDNIKSSKETAKDLLVDFQNLKGDVVKYIDELDKKLLELEDDLVNMRQQQSGIQENLENVQKELEQDQRTEKQQYSSMKMRIRYLYEHGNYSFMDALAGSTSFGDMLNRSSVASMIQQYDSQLLADYRDALTAISEKENYISQKQQELAQITLDLETEKESVDALIADKSEELETYNNNIKAAGNLIQSYEEAEKEQEQEIAAAEAAYLDDSDEMYAELPSEYTGGKFLWPVPGHYQITSRFGYRVHPLTGTRRLHGGIDIAIPTGCGIYAGADGVVAVATYSSSAGNYVLINHGGGLCTVYMHNSKLLVSVGDKVKRGQKIALGGSTGWSTGPHCHFGVRRNGTYVNPIPYLKSTKSSDDADYSEDAVPDTNDVDTVTPTTEEQESDTSQYTTEADDSGDNGKKSSDLKDDSDPDSE